jgi:hypothetical protein
MTPSAERLLDKLITVATNVELEDAPSDFVAVAYAIHALALSLLPAAIIGGAGHNVARTGGRFNERLESFLNT